MYYYKDNTIIFTINIAELQQRWFYETEKSMLRNRAYFINTPNLPLELRNYRRVRNSFIIPIEGFLEIPNE